MHAPLQLVPNLGMAFPKQAVGVGTLRPGEESGPFRDLALEPMLGCMDSPSHGDGSQ